MKNWARARVRARTHAHGLENQFFSLNVYTSEANSPTEFDLSCNLSVVKLWEKESTVKIFDISHTFQIENPTQALPPCPVVVLYQPNPAHLPPNDVKHDLPKIPKS